MQIWTIPDGKTDFWECCVRFRGHLIEDNFHKIVSAINVLSDRFSNDSTHATTPNMGQGACQAIEGAYVLSECLVDNTPNTAFATCQKLRKPKALTVVKTSWKNCPLEKSDCNQIKELYDATDPKFNKSQTIRKSLYA